MKKYILALLLGTVSSVTYAEQTTCGPISNSRWTEASVDLLENGSQVLYHVKASGPYLVADLICSLDKCVGFINFVDAEGTLQISSKGKITGINFQSFPPIPVGIFSCH